MAATKKAQDLAEAERAAAEYREALIDHTVEDLIGALALKTAEWNRAREARESETARLLLAEVQAENDVVAAFDAARKAGAKVKALEKINLKPTTAIAAVSKREKAERGPRSSTRSSAAGGAKSADRVPTVRPIVGNGFPDEQVLPRIAHGASVDA
jgi:hypothetical protein